MWVWAGVGAVVLVLFVIATALGQPPRRRPDASDAAGEVERFRGYRGYRNWR